MKQFLQYNPKMTDVKLSNNMDSGKRDFYATCYMLAAVLLYALFPVFIHVGEGHQAPFMYNAVRLLFMGMGISIFLIVFYRRQLFDREIWRVVCRNWRRWSLLGTLLGAFNYAIFGWALRYIDVSVASVLYETWPLWMILLMGKMFQTENRYKSLGVFGWACILMGFVGLSFVILSQTSGIVFEGETMSLFHLFLGVSLALIASILTAMSNGCSIRWGTTVLMDIPDCKQKEIDKDLTMLFVLMAIVLASIPNIIISVSLGGWGGHNEIIEIDNMIIAAIHGFFILTAARIFLRTANLITTKLEINAIAYGAPIFALAYLAMLGYINVPNTDWLIVGAIGVVVANILLNLKVTRWLTCQYLVVVLWACGTIVYIRPLLSISGFLQIMILATPCFFGFWLFCLKKLGQCTPVENKIMLKTRPVLWILAVITASVLLLFVPKNIDITGTIGFLLEMAEFLLATFVFFLSLHIQGLQYEIKYDIINPHQISFPDDRNRIVARRISIVFCVGIVATFGILFWFKWMHT